MPRLGPRNGYETLANVLDSALDQAQSGKGHERHAGPGEAFHDQQIVQLGEWMGSTHGEVFQACKKAIESTRLPPERARAELLGAINYLAAAVIVLERLSMPRLTTSSTDKSDGEVTRALTMVLRQAGMRGVAWLPHDSSWPIVAVGVVAALHGWSRFADSLRASSASAREYARALGDGGLQKAWQTVCDNVNNVRTMSFAFLDGFVAITIDTTVSTFPISEVVHRIYTIPSLVALRTRTTGEFASDREA